MFGSKVMNRRLRCKVLLTCKSGEAFEGVLYEFDRTAFVLRNVRAVAPSTNPDPAVTPIDGELLVLVDDVAFLQVI